MGGQHVLEILRRCFNDRLFQVNSGVVDEDPGFGPCDMRCLLDQSFCTIQLSDVVDNEMRLLSDGLCGVAKDLFPSPHEHDGGSGESHAFGDGLTESASSSG